MVKHMFKSSYRVTKHLCYPKFRATRKLVKEALQGIESKINSIELATSAELCFAIEGALTFPALLKRTSARTRAIQVFSNLHVWDTEDNTGVLLYFLIADRRFEIVVDRGVKAKIPQETWERVAQEMAEKLKCSPLAEAIVFALEKIGEELVQGFPATGKSKDEIPNSPRVLG